MTKAEEEIFDKQLKEIVKRHQHNADPDAVDAEDEQKENQPDVMIIDQDK